MFLGLRVELEDPGLSSRPWATWSVIVVCVLVAALAWSSDFMSIVELLGFVPAMLYTNFLYGLMTLVSSFFLHADFFHLLANMWFLLMFGDNTEDDLGTGNFLLLLFLATVVGDLAHALGDPRAEIPTIGASGGISGILAYYVLRFPNARITFLFLPFLRVLTVPAYGWVAFWFFLQIILAVFQLHGVSSVSALAHLGGFLTGAIACVWVTQRRYALLRAARQAGRIRG